MAEGDAAWDRADVGTSPLTRAGAIIPIRNAPTSRWAGDELRALDATAGRRGGP